MLKVKHRKKIYENSILKINMTKSLVLSNSLSQQLQLYPSPFLQERYLAHIIDQNEHLQIFDNPFYKYILKSAFSQKSKVKTCFVCPSNLSWTINLLMQLSFFTNYFAYIPDELS